MSSNNLFLNEKPVKILLTIRRSSMETYATKIRERIDSTYAHTVKTISTLEDEGFIQSEKKGRKRVLELTDKGEEYAEVFEEMSQVMEFGEAKSQNRLKW